MGALGACEVMPTRRNELTNTAGGLKNDAEKKELMKNGSGSKMISFGIANSLSPPSRVIRMIAQTAVVIKFSGGHNRAISRTKE